MITLEQAKKLEPGTTVYTADLNADGTAVRWKVNGRVQTWKRDASRVRVPIKNGLRNYDAIEEGVLDLIFLDPEEAKAAATSR